MLVALIHLPSEHWTLKQIVACCVLAVYTVAFALYVWEDETRRRRRR